MDEEVVLEPMSPSAQYMKSSALSVTILAVLEMEVDIDDSSLMPIFKEVLLPTNHRYSSIMEAARYIYTTSKNVSMSISNVIGPVEQMVVANQPCKGLYFVTMGPPQSLFITMVSYEGKLRIAVTTDKGFIDQNEIKSCIEYAFEVIHQAALEA